MNKYENQQLFKHLHTTIAATGTPSYGRSKYINKRRGRGKTFTFP